MDGPLALLFFVTLVLFGLLIYQVSQGSETSEEIQARFLFAVASNLTYGAVRYRGSLLTLKAASSTTRKRALLYGLNYRNTRNELRGCITDVQNLQTYLQARQFTCEVYTDDTSRRPTYDVILNTFRSFVLSLQEGDIGFIWYSGHGTMVRTRNAWVPLDFASRGFVYEETLRTMLRSVNKNVRLFIGSDSCYSGTFFNLKYDVEPSGSISTLIQKNALLQTRHFEDGHIAETIGVTRDETLSEHVFEPWDRSILLDAAMTIENGCSLYVCPNQAGHCSKLLTPGYYSKDVFNIYGLSDTIRSVKIPEGLSITFYQDEFFREPMVTLQNEMDMPPITNFRSITVQEGTTRSNTVLQKQVVQNYWLYDVKKSLNSMNAFIVFVSSCKDTQVAYDASIEGSIQGATTWSFLRSLSSNTNKTMSLGLLQDTMRLGLRRRGFSQVPQLSFGSPINPFTNVTEFGL